MLCRMDKDSVVAMLRRRSTGFSRGVSQYRGVTRHHQPGRWEARIGRVAGSRYLVSAGSRIIYMPYICTTSLQNRI